MRTWSALVAVQPAGQRAGDVLYARASVRLRQGSGGDRLPPEVAQLDVLCAASMRFVQGYLSMAKLCVLH
ncbi:hypothetical protein [Mycobacterium basiliense]|uniref:hypothetical protein n=1 Tax=Mycobacterium basiliense TaxID=2094119 RepID=UPI001E3C00FA|nr:hypothetical protein [Mycobacterium basiliense]